MHWSPPAGTPTDPPAGPFTPYLAPDVGAMIAAENAKYGGAIETAWCGKWDGERELVTSARLLFRGNQAQVPYATYDIRPGEIDIHNHPIHSGLFPSEADTKFAAVVANIGAGMLIVSWDCREGYLVRPPLSLGKLTPPRVWHWRRFTLMYHPGSR